MVRLAVLLALVATAVLPAAVRGQEVEEPEVPRQPRECEFTADNFTTTEVRPGEKMTEWKGSVLFQCTDGTVLRSDDAVRYEWLNEMQFTGNVTYRDATRTLTANYLRQLGAGGDVYADGGVTITDHQTGAVIQGTTMQIWGASETRPEPLTVVRGRPTAVFQPGRGAPRQAGGAAPETAGAGIEPGAGPAGEFEAGPTTAYGGEPPAGPGAASGQTVRIVADSMQFVGDALFRALGRVEITTDEGHGQANAADYFMDEDRFRLRGNAEFHDRGYTTLGDTIHFWMVDGEPAAFAAHPNASVTGEDLLIAGDSIHGELAGGRPQVVRVHGNARLENATARMEAWRLAVEFEGEEVSVLRAVGRARAEADDGARRGSNADGIDGADAAGDGDAADAEPFAGLARIHTGTQFMAADSIEVLAPGGALEEVRAIGNAYAEQLAHAPGAGAPGAPAAADAGAGGGAAGGNDATSGEPDAAGDGAAAADDAASPGGGDGEPDATTERRRPPLPEILARDWLRGDTIVAYFEADTAAAASAADTALAAPVDAGERPERVLRRLIATGAGDALASAVYRMWDRRTGPSAEPTIHYVRSSRIELDLQGGEIATADFGDPVYGRSYQPVAAVPVEAVAVPAAEEDGGAGAGDGADGAPAAAAPAGGAGDPAEGGSRNDDVNPE